MAPSGARPVKGRTFATTLWAAGRLRSMLVDPPPRPRPGRRDRTTGTLALNAGATPGALEAFLALRGLRTLSLRLDAAQETAARLADWLAGHPAIATVRYPGLASHPSHELAATQLDGFGSMISFDIAAGARAADVVCENVVVIRHATSLGSVESTMERRAAVPGQEHLPPGLLRLI